MSNSTVAPLFPVKIDWSKVGSVRVTLETPYAPQRGGLRFRYGTQKPVRNMAYDPKDPDNPPYFPGVPIMYPEDEPAIAGDADREWFEMPTDAAMQCFGHWGAPKESGPKGLHGFTQSTERERVALFWGWYELPRGNGTMHPPMNRIGAPRVPDVSIRPLDKRHRPMKGADGQEIVIRIREFYNFDDPMQYELLPGLERDPKFAGTLQVPTVAATVDPEAARVFDLLKDLSSDEIGRLKDLLRPPRKAPDGKQG